MGTEQGTYLRRYREAAKQCSNVKYREAMLLVADELAGRIDLLANNSTEENMQALTGCWAKAARLLRDRPPEADPTPLGGSIEPARLAA